MVKIEKKLIDNNKVFVTFEAGATHNGIKSAKKLIDLAKNAKADAIKFQMFRNKNLIMKKNMKFKFKILNKNGKYIAKSENLKTIFERRFLNDKEWFDLKKYADKKKILFFVTIGDVTDIEIVKKLKCHSIKIASADIDYFNLIDEAAKLKINIQIDTGNSSFYEIKKAINIVERYHKNIIIHYCPPGYPTSIKDINFKNMEKIRSLGYPIGYSDHLPGNIANFVAIFKNVFLIEKTISLNKYTPNVEHCFSLNRHEANNFVADIKKIKYLITNNNLQNFVSNKKYRRGVYLKKAHNKNKLLDINDVIFAKPNKGLSAKNFYFLKKPILNKRKQKFAPLKKSDLKV